MQLKTSQLVKIIFITLVTFFLIINIPKLWANPSLPSLQVHPLPETLEKWQDHDNLGDYFDQITPSDMGHLIWSQFPVKIYVDYLPNPAQNIASEKRFQQWTNAVLKTIDEWKIYLPLTVIESREEADILILRSQPPLGSRLDPETGQLIIPRARAAQTSYQFMLKENRLIHQMTINISPQLSELSVLSASRHELGHGLGIWGHSLVETDALYFSQVRSPPLISPRDINTLKKVYQQPTRLGWKINRKNQED